MPSTILYPLEQIGCTVSGLRLFHDSYGRVAVAQQDEVFVLNDTTWQRLRRGPASGLNFHQVSCDASGEIYYSVFGAWGALKNNGSGGLEPVSLVPPDAPEWTHSCDFRDIYFTDTGVLLWGQDGVVFFDRVTRAHRYFRVRGVSCLFPLKGQFVISTFQDGLFVLDVAAGTWSPLSVEMDEVPVVIAAAGDGSSSLLVATTRGQFFALREGRLVAVEMGDTERLAGPIVALVKLPEGGFAASVAGYGVFLISADGVVGRVLDGSDFRGVVALESTEPGVLWAVSERGVLKILHHQPFTAYGRDQGLLVSWPQIVRWQGRTIIASGGRVYEAYAMKAEGGTRFRTMIGQPDGLAWGIAVVGESLLIGYGHGVYEVGRTGAFNLVLPGINVARLVAIDTNTCLVILTDTIAAIRREGGQWVECAKRIPGLGYPYVTHAGTGSAWLELGINRVGRVSLVDGRLQSRLIETFAWDARSWVNVSVVGSTVVLGGPKRMPMFLDDRTLQPVEAPELRSVVEASPYTLQRFERDEAGTLWVSHARGLFPARPRQGRYMPDFSIFSGINEMVPLIQCLPAGGVWASTDKSLYRLEAGEGNALPVPLRPVLVAMKDSRTGALLSAAGARSGALGSLRYAQNSLQLDFFAGSYAWMRPFSYEYRLGEATWERANASSSVFLADLPEGNYSLEVRAVDTLGPVGEVASFQLSVQAPWYRTWAAYAAYPVLAILIVYLAMRYSAHRHRLRLAELELQVGSRTAELRTAMDCLREEATANATLAERNRLAGEIHDSLEQGFAGLLLQLESTSRLPSCARPVQFGLAAAINMVEYCRDELRNAVRGLHSPVLDTESLETAIRRIGARLSPLAGFVTMRVDGSSRRLNPAIEHHLLRIAQEALGNVVKHAGATKVEVVLGFTVHEVRLSISDNGCGFDPRALAEADGSHLGLPSLSKRARTIGGAIDIESRPGQGTTVSVVVPETLSVGGLS